MITPTATTTMMTATMAAVFDELLLPVVVVGTLVDVVDVVDVVVGAVVVDAGALVVGGMVTGAVVTGVVTGGVVGAAVVGGSVDGGATVVDVVCAPAPATAKGSKRPSRAVTMTTAKALRATDFTDWRMGRRASYPERRARLSPPDEKRSRASGCETLQLAEPLHIALDERHGKTTALADFDPLPAGPGAHRRGPSQILLDDLRWQSTALAHGNPIFARPLPDRRRLRQVQLNYRLRNTAAGTDADPTFTGPRPHVGGRPLIFTFQAIVISHMPPG